MILNPEWLKPKEKPYFHQISMDCLEKLVDCIGRFNKGEIDNVYDYPDYFLNRVSTSTTIPSKSSACLA